MLPCLAPSRAQTGGLSELLDALVLPTLHQRYSPDADLAWLVLGLKVFGRNSASLQESRCSGGLMMTERRPPPKLAVPLLLALIAGASPRTLLLHSFNASSCRFRYSWLLSCPLQARAVTEVQRVLKRE